MIEIDWKQDYCGEFICPKCQTLGMIVWGIHKLANKRQFRCPTCRHICLESCQIHIRAVVDPINVGVTWYTNHKIKGFVCPECQIENIYFTRIGNGKRRFICRACRKEQYDSLDLQAKVISRFNENLLPVKPLIFDEEQWDLRAIHPNFDLRDMHYSVISFADIDPNWFQQEVKRFVQYLCKTDSSLAYITYHLSSLRVFSRYLRKAGIVGFHQINRTLILDYLAQEQIVNKQKLGSLRSFFTTGTVKGWFNIDPDIIRDDDYPKRHRGNPDPLSDKVCEQIEQNLHKLPDPIARMWLVCYFAAMRPSELALLKQDCLVQEGEHWKLVWHRKKGNDYHEVPISRTIVKVVQEQLEYIHNLWGNDWNYLFCHYHGLSSTDPQSPKLKPVKKIIPIGASPLVLSIRCLIQALDIRDENGQLAEFSPRLLRPTRLTQLFEQGHDLSVVSAWAGHKHFATTSTYYTEVSCELMEREAGHIQPDFSRDVEKRSWLA